MKFESSDHHEMSLDEFKDFISGLFEKHPELPAKFTSTRNGIQAELIKRSAKPGEDIVEHLEDWNRVSSPAFQKVFQSILKKDLNNLKSGNRTFMDDWVDDVNREEILEYVIAEMGDEQLAA